MSKTQCASVRRWEAKDRVHMACLGEGESSSGGCLGRGLLGQHPGLYRWGSQGIPCLIYQIDTSWKQFTVMEGTFLLCPASKPFKFSKYPDLVFFTLNPKEKSLVPYWQNQVSCFYPLIPFFLHPNKSFIFSALTKK